MKRMIAPGALFRVISLLLMLVLLGGCTPKENEKDVNDMVDYQWNVMSLQESEEIYPASFDLDAAKAAGLIETSIGEEKYQRLESAYLAALNDYLEETVSLSSYETALRESGLNFYPVEDNLYYRFRSYGRDNLYLRNNAYIERLSADQLALLEQAVTPEGITVSPALKEMVAQTWKDVITVQMDPNAAEAYPINYEMDAVNDFMANSDALTFVLGYCAEYDADGNTISDQAEAHKYQVATQLCTAIESELSKMLDCPVKVFIIVGDHHG